MSTFRQHINRETATINEFDEATGDNIKVRKIMNNSFSTYDFTFSANDKYIYFCEVKTRAVYHNQYPDTILEQGKVDRMNKKVQEAIKLDIVPQDIRAGFLVKFLDGMYFFDMSIAPTTTSTKICPKTTASNGDRTYKSKKLVHYKIKDATRIK